MSQRSVDPSVVAADLNLNRENGLQAPRYLGVTLHHLSSFLCIHCLSPLPTQLHLFTCHTTEMEADRFPPPPPPSLLQHPPLLQHSPFLYPYHLHLNPNARDITFPTLQSATIAPEIPPMGPWTRPSAPATPDTTATQEGPLQALTESSSNVEKWTFVFSNCPAQDSHF